MKSSPRLQNVGAPKGAISHSRVHCGLIPELSTAVSFCSQSPCCVNVACENNSTTRPNTGGSPTARISSSHAASRSISRWRKLHSKKMSCTNWTVCPGDYVLDDVVAAQIGNCCGVDAFQSDAPPQIRSPGLRELNEGALPLIKALFVRVIAPARPPDIQKLHLRLRCGLPGRAVQGSDKDRGEERTPGNLSDPIIAKQQRTQERLFGGKLLGLCIIERLNLNRCNTAAAGEDGWRQPST